MHVNIVNNFLLTPFGNFCFDFLSSLVHISWAFVDKDLKVLPYYSICIIFIGYTYTYGYCTDAILNPQQEYKEEREEQYFYQMSNHICLKLIVCICLLPIGAWGPECVGHLARCLILTQRHMARCFILTEKVSKFLIFPSVLNCVFASNDICISSPL